MRIIRIKAICAQGAVAVSLNLARAYSAIWGLVRGPALSLHLRGWVAFRRTAAMASASSSCPAATLITKW